MKSNLSTNALLSVTAEGTSENIKYAGKLTHTLPKTNVTIIYTINIGELELGVKSQKIPHPIPHYKTKYVQLSPLK